MIGSDVLSWSYVYADAHWHVFPVSPRGKRPLEELRNGKDHATDDRVQIERWFANGHGDRNVGISCKPSMLVVIDVDTPKEKNDWTDGRAELIDLIARFGPLPETPTADTGSGGVHRVFRAPTGTDLVGHAGRAIDVIRNGYIVAPPSVHESGNSYRWRDDLAPDEIAVAELPATWIDMLRRRPSPAATSRDPGSSDERKVKRARGYIAAMNASIDGQRGHDALWAAVCRVMHGFDLDDATTRSIIVEDFNPRCQPAWNDNQIDHKIQSARDTADAGRWRVEDREPANGARTQSNSDTKEINSNSESETKARWIVPLVSFLGDEEPSDDDREDWLIRDIAPRGEALLFAGPPKCGKTWAMLDMGIAVAMGRTWLTHENTVGEPVRVLLLGYEDGLRRMRKRVWELCRAHGITPNDRILREHLIISREPLSLPGDEKAFTAEIKQWKPSLVLVDNLTRVMVGDPNSTKDAAKFGNTWIKIVNDVGGGMGFLHHTAKIGALSFNDRNAGDPFELVRGSGDFVATARHIILMRSIEAPGEKLSDVRMRGNLDLRCESFVAGFSRIETDGRWSAQLTNLGDGDSVRERIAGQRKEKNEAQRKLEQAAEFERRREVALSLIRRDGACSTRTLAAALGLKSPRSVQPMFDALMSSNVVSFDSKRGYMFADQEVVT